MHKTALSTALLAALSLVAAGNAVAEEASPFTANVGIISDYAYRGISQTDENPALQGGFDYSHPSGFYAGVWGSNVSWLRDAERGTDASSGNSLELDLYGGYKTALGPIGVDVGALQYWYPGSYSSNWRAATGMKNPNTTEGYVGLSWEFLTFKYSYAFTDLFGVPDSDGSQYFDLGASYDVGAGFTVDAHFGRQKIKGGGSYNDWKLGVSKEFGGFGFGLHYVDTDLDSNIAVADKRVILSMSKSF